MHALMQPWEYPTPAAYYQATKQAIAADRRERRRARKIKRQQRQESRIYNRELDKAYDTVTRKQQHGCTATLQPTDRPA